jgi:hypothetical protein
MGASVSQIEATLTSDKTSYLPGDALTLSLVSSVNFNGILIYATSSTDPTKRVGSFDIPKGFQDNSQVCVNSEVPNSSLTHTAEQNYDLKQTFKYTPSKSISGNLTFSLILVASVDNQYAFVVQSQALVIPSSAVDSTTSSTFTDSMTTASSVNTIVPSDTSTTASVSTKKFGYGLFAASPLPSSSIPYSASVKASRSAALPEFVSPSAVVSELPSSAIGSTGLNTCQCTKTITIIKKCMKKHKNVYPTMTKNKAAEIVTSIPTSTKCNDQNV